MKTLSLCLIVCLCLVGCSEPRNPRNNLPPPNPQNDVPKQEEAKQEEVKQQEVRKQEINRVTLINYYRIKDGMTYEQVERILVPTTEEVASSGSITMLTWQAPWHLGANTCITFENGRVSAKAQMGLPNGESTPDYKTKGDIEQQERQELREQQRQAAAEQKAKVMQDNQEKAEETRNLSTRKWTDISGDFSAEAQYMYIIDKVVYPKRTNSGKIIKVPLEKLCTEDKQWIDDWQKRKPVNTE